MRGITVLRLRVRTPQETRRRDKGANAALGMTPMWNVVTARPSQRPARTGHPHLGSTAILCPSMKVAIQGELGSFSHEAAGKMLPRATVVPCARSAEVFDRVEHGSPTQP